MTSAEPAAGAEDAGEVQFPAEDGRERAAGAGRRRREKPDLILLDLMMPGIDGFEVIRRLRADPETADIQIVILSALNSNEDVVKGFNVGANDFIMKPIIMEKLLSCVVTQMQLVEAKAAAK
ncbi:MAG: response regulator [Bacteroidales bacterium]|nr:response regulator [Bacteroidales bacterium]